MVYVKVGLHILDFVLAAAESDDAPSITQKASQAYKNLPASTKVALKDEGVAHREQMTRADMKRRAEQIGKKIQQLVCFIQCKTARYKTCLVFYVAFH